MAVQCWQSLLPAVVPIPLDTLQPLLASAGDEEGNSSTQQANNAPLGKERALRILIVEDEILTADYTKYLLLEMGYESAVTPPMPLPLSEWLIPTVQTWS
jgi:hypothetical protein